MATRRLSDAGTLVRTRTRATYRLPRFDGEGELTVEGACFDRLELTREYLLQSLPRDYEGPVELAEDIGRAHQSAVSLAPLDPRCQAFSSVRDGRGEGVVKLKLGSTEAGARWLIDLSIEFRNVHAAHRSSADVARRTPIYLKLRTAMNPTRLAAHAFSRGVSPTCTDWRELLTSDETTYRAIADTSVSEHHDNLLPIQFLQPVALSRMIDETRRFLGAIDNLVEHIVGAQLLLQRPATGAWLAASADWSIRQAETYWEFGNVHAIEYVRRLRPTLWLLGNDAGERVWVREDSRETIAFTARLTETIRLALYPKTVDRIRLEVRYLKRPPRARGQGIETPGQHIEAHLRAIADDALRRANRARREIVERREQPNARSADGSLDALCELVTLLQDFYRERPDRAGDILRLLLSRGGLRCRENEFPVSKAEAQMLKDRGIVTTSPLARHSTTGDLMYSLAPQYQPLFEHFSGLG